MGVFHCRAIVFDKDGVLLDTMAMIRSAWSEWAVARGLDADEVMASIHMTGYELLEIFAPAADPAAEFRWIGARQSAHEASIAAFDGAAGLLRSLPGSSWAIVTSARREVSVRHLELAGLPVPRVMVCSEDTPRGKPDPAGYLLAAVRLGVPATDCMAIEDAPAGVRAARAAGMFVVALTTTHEAALLAEANVVVPTLGAIDVAADDAGLRVTAPAEPSAARG